MKIIQLGVGAIPVNSGSEYGGTEKCIYWVAYYLGRLGCQVHVIDIKGGARQSQERQEFPAKFYEVRHPSLRSSYNLPFLMSFFNYLLLLLHLFLFAIPTSIIINRLLGREKIEIIQGHSSLPFLAAIAVKKLRRSPAIFVYLTHTAFGTSKLGWRKRLPALPEILALKWADHVIAEAPSVKKWLASEFNIKPAKISQIYSGVAVDEIEEFLSGKAGPHHQSKIVLSVGTISPRKNQLSVIKAIPRVVAAHPEVKFVFAGSIIDDKHFKSIQRFIADNNLSSYVEIRGAANKQELYNLYSKAALLVFPSLAETQGLVLTEAMAFGLPVVASTIGPFADVVNQYEGSAILVDPHDADGIAAAVIRLLEDGSLWQAMSQRGKEAAQSFSWERIAAQTLALYEGLVQNKKELSAEAGKQESVRKAGLAHVVETVESGLSTPGLAQHMKIVQLGVGAIPVHSGTEYGGIEKGVYWVAHHLGRMGCQVYVIDIKGGTQHRQERQQSAARFYEVWHPPLRNSYHFPFLISFFSYSLLMLHLFLFALPSSLVLNRLMGRQKIQVIHAYASLPALAAMAVKKLRRSPTILIYLLSTAFGTSKLSWRKRLPALPEILALKWADHIIIEAPSVKKWLASEFNIKPAKISQIYSGVAVDEIEEFLSGKAGPHHQSKIVLLVGVISPRKNQLTVIKAAPRVVAAHPEVKFVFVGPIIEDEHFNSIQRFIADNNLSSHVEIKGVVTKQELYNLYSEAALLVIPSLAETQGLVLIEAMAFGLPVIASTIEPFADVANQYQGSAILVDPHDADGIAAAVIRLLEDSSLWQAMSQKGKETAQSFSWEQVAAQTLALYERLVQNKKELVSEARK